MASNAIIRRRRLLSDYLHIPSRSLQGVSHGFSTTRSESRDSSPTRDYPFKDFGSTKYVDGNVTRREESKKLSALENFRTGGFYTIAGHGTLGRMLPVRVNMMLQSSGFATMATAPKPELGGGDEDNDKVSKRKEASPEECDQAVEGLTSAKAKVKAKQVSESQKTANSILKKTKAMLLGIGPALKAVASMSRFDIRSCNLFIN